MSLTGKLSLQFAMVGTWLNPFKYQYLALSNLNLAIGISVGAGGVLPTFGTNIRLYSSLRCNLYIQIFPTLLQSVHGILVSSTEQILICISSVAYNLAR